MRYAGVGGGVGVGGVGVDGGFLRIITSEPRDDGIDAKTAGNNTIIGDTTPASNGDGDGDGDGEMNIE